MNMMMAQEALPAVQAVATSNVFAHVDMSHALAKMRERSKGLTTLAARVGSAGVEGVGFVWGCIKNLFYRLAKMLGVKVVPIDEQGKAEVHAAPGDPLSAGEAAKFMAKQATQLLQELSDTKVDGDDESAFVQRYLDRVKIAQKSYADELAACKAVLNKEPPLHLEAARKYLEGKDSESIKGLLGAKPADHPLVVAMAKHDQLEKEWRAFAARFAAVLESVKDSHPRDEMDAVDRAFGITALVGDQATDFPRSEIETPRVAGVKVPTIAMGPNARPAQSALASVPEIVAPDVQASQPVPVRPRMSGAFSLGPDEMAGQSLGDIGVDRNAVEEIVQSDSSYPSFANAPVPKG